MLARFKFNDSLSAYTLLFYITHFQIELLIYPLCFKFSIRNFKINYKKVIKQVKKNFKQVKKNFKQLKFLKQRLPNKSLTVDLLIYNTICLVTHPKLTSTGIKKQTLTL